MTTSFTSLTDKDLLERMPVLAAQERRATAELVASLAELDARRLYLGAGYSSLFAYCTHALHLSESAAYARIEAARAARRFPEVLARLDDGRLTLSSVCLLARVLTEENQGPLLDAAAHKSKREVESIVARIRPQPSVPTTVRKLPPPVIAVEVAPAARSQSPYSGEAAPDPVMPTLSPAPAQRPVVRPLAPEIYRVQFTLSRDGHDRLRRAQDLLRHAVPNGDAAAIFERALTLLVDHLEHQKFAATSNPRPERPARAKSRYVPAAVRRAVWRRDAGRCAFVGRDGRCAERGFLEFHHVTPYADGGAASVENLQLRCQAHNGYEAALWEGTDMVRERVPCGWCTRSGPSSGMSVQPDVTPARARARTWPARPSPATVASRPRCHVSAPAPADGRRRARLVADSSPCPECRRTRRRRRGIHRCDDEAGERREHGGAG